MVPRNLKESTALIKQFCLHCAGRSKNVQDDCNDATCPFLDMKNAPMQLVLFDEKFRDIFFHDVVALVPEMPERFTVNDLKALYISHNKGTGGAADFHWWGTLALRKDFRSLVYAVDRIVSRNKRSRGNTTILWQKKNSCQIETARMA